MEKYWSTGHVLPTQETACWSTEELAKANEFEAKLVLSDFSLGDESRSRKLICVCDTKEQAQRVVDDHNRLVNRIGELEQLARHPVDS